MPRISQAHLPTIGIIGASGICPGQLPLKIENLLLAGTPVFMCVLDSRLLAEQVSMTSNNMATKTQIPKFSLTDRHGKGKAILLTPHQSRMFSAILTESYMLAEAFLARMASSPTILSKTRG